MAEFRPGTTPAFAEGESFTKMLRRRKVMIGVGALLGIVLVCVAAILIMLQRLEARNASFQPPMTELERQRLLPPDPILDAAPKLDGLRYGRQDEPGSGAGAGGYSPVENDTSQEGGALTRALMQHTDELHAETDMRASTQRPRH
ncbi:hypothetical protein ACIQAL_07530 [Pseudomonas sp. NPDC088368]|jgi:hypothetical protein|uniref:hypothetical protein n=1 Tax=Pseudomonas sp. NPDC088368 TaxID=3364453 RepID=UPI00380C0B55